MADIFFGAVVVPVIGIAAILLVIWVVYRRS